MSWDQRIPNEPIFRRNFFIDRPVIIPSERPYTTYCTGKMPIGILNERKRYNDSSEKQIKRYYTDNILNDQGGLPLLGDKKTLKPEMKTSEYLSGIHYNIDSETKVKPYEILRSKDCFKAGQIDERGLKTSNDEGIEARNSKLWNINTSPKFIKRS